jgi:hypothetical protein
MGPGIDTIHSKSLCQCRSREIPNCASATFPDGRHHSMRALVFQYHKDDLGTVAGVESLPGSLEAGRGFLSCYQDIPFAHSTVCFCLP